MRIAAPADDHACSLTGSSKVSAATVVLLLVTVVFPIGIHAASSQVHTAATVTPGGLVRSAFDELDATSGLNITQLFAFLWRGNKAAAGSSSPLESDDDSIHQNNNSNQTHDDDSTNNKNYQCRTYLAPSTIPGAGLGMFAGVSLKEGDEVTPGDAVVPIRDITWHNSVDGFTNDFLWDEYVWSGNSFKYMTEPGHSVKAASFGIGAAPNCFFPLLNVEDSGSTVRHDYAHVPRDSPGIGAFTPWHDRQSHANRDIEAGMEIFVDYGYGYFEGQREDIFGLIPFLSDFDIADEMLQKYVKTRNLVRSRIDRHASCPSTKTYTKGLTDGEGSAQQQCNNANESRNITLALQSDLFALTKNVMAAFPTRTVMALPEADRIDEASSSSSSDHSSTVDSLLENGGTAYKDYSRSIRDLDFLKEYGLCMDYLVAKPSTIPEAGRGAFAVTDLATGTTVAPLPLIHIPRRSVLNMYAEDTMVNPETGRVYEDDRTQLLHAQMLLNYCMGHRDSTLLLCNYGVVSSLVNHAPTVSTDGGPTANVKVVWSDKITAHPEWRNMPVDQWAFNYQTGLGFEYVATKDIAQGDEIFVDYGAEWQNAWQEHVDGWEPVTRLVDELNKDIDSVVPTVEEWKWSMGDPNQKNNAVNLWCRDEYRDMQKLPTAPNDAYPCKIILRDDHAGGYNGPVYTAEIVILNQGDVDEEDGECREEFDEVLWAVSRDALAYGGVYEMNDTREYSQPWAFRHDIRIPDEIMPEAWKNLLVGAEGNSSDSDDNAADMQEAENDPED